jgi:hypothetical protein
VIDCGRQYEDYGPFDKAIMSPVEKCLPLANLQLSSSIELSLLGKPFLHSRWRNRCVEQALELRIMFLRLAQAGEYRSCRHEQSLK